MITLAAVMSDADGLSYLAGAAVYADWHHTLGHTFVTGAALAVLAGLIVRGRRWGGVGLLVFVAFTSHLVGDYFFSAWSLPLFSPFSDSTFVFRPPIRLDHPINIALSYAGFAAMAASIWFWKRTPLEFLWPRLDKLLAQIASPKLLTCQQCSRSTAVACNTCGQGVCLRHARMTPRAAVRCRSCADLSQKQL